VGRGGAGRGGARRGEARGEARRGERREARGGERRGEERAREGLLVRDWRRRERVSPVAGCASQVGDGERVDDVRVCVSARHGGDAKVSDTRQVVPSAASWTCPGRVLAGGVSAGALRGRRCEQRGGGGAGRCVCASAGVSVSERCAVPLVLLGKLRVSRRCLGSV